VANFAGACDRDFVVPYSPAFVGVQLAVQGAWDDSVSGQMALTRRGTTQIAEQPEGKMMCLYTDGAVTGAATAQTAWMDRIPVVRYTYR
jgi:hypothetical protein